MRVITRETDIAGKWRAIVELDNGNTLQFKYDTPQTDRLVLVACKTLQTTQAAEATKISTETKVVVTRGETITEQIFTQEPTIVEVAAVISRLPELEIVEPAKVADYATR